MRQAFATLILFMATLAMAGPAEGNTGPTVDAHEYNRVEDQDGMLRNKVHDIFDTSGVVKTKRLADGTFPVSITIVGTRVYVGPHQTRWYNNACDDSPVTVDYTYHLGKWVLTYTDAYFPQTYPDNSHSCLYPHPNH